MDEIRNEINNLGHINSDVLSRVFDKINNEENEDVREELIDTLILKTKDNIQELYNEGLVMSVDRYIEATISMFSKYSGLSYNEMEELFEKNGLVVENIVPEEDLVEVEENEEEVIAELVEDDEADSEIDIENEEEKELVEENEEVVVAELVEDDEADSETDVENEIEEELEIMKINDRISELESELSNDAEDDINKQIEELEKEKAEVLAKIDKEIDALNIIQSKSEEELKVEIDKLKEEQRELWRLSNNSSLNAEDEKRFHEINDLIAKKEKNIENVKIIREKEELKTKLNKLREEERELWRLSSIGSINAEDEKRFHEINNLIKESEKQLDELSKQLPEPSKEELDKLSTLLTNRIEVIKDYDKRILDCKNDSKKQEELNELKAIRDAYCKIQSEAIQQFEALKLKDNDLKGAIPSFVMNHPLISELDKWNEPDKLKNQLMNDVYKNLQTKKIDKKENRKKALLKALSAVAGFGSGLALHSVPGVGTVLAGVWAVKLAKKAINVITNKFPNSKVTGIINGISEKISDKYGEFREKHPKIAKVVEKVRKVLKSDYTKWFVNGFTAGYAVGNIADSIRIRQSHCGGEVEYTAPEHNAPNVEGDMTPVTEPSAPSINSGDVLDVSSIDKGLVSATSDNPVSLITEAGKEVIADRSVVLPDGKVMWHFKQMSGQGYAWLEEEAVKEVLTNVASGASKIK